MYLTVLTKTVAAYDVCSCIRALKEEISLYRSLRQPYSGSTIRRDKAETAAENYLDKITDHFLT
jgi:hypothetical protein